MVHGNTAKKLTAPAGKEKRIGMMAEPVREVAAEAVSKVREGQEGTAREVKNLEVKAIQSRIEGLKDRLEDLRNLAISEGCPDPRAKGKK